MSSIDVLERQVQQLDPKELAHFRDWFLEYDWQAWDRQLERDVKAGKLDGMVQKALADHAAGRTKPL